MNLVGTKFGRGPRELGGSVDLINHFKLRPHHEFFCKRSLPSKISESQYLRNVVGETEIKKGEGMELDQLFPNNTSFVELRHAHLHPFNLGVLREAFQKRETTPVDFLDVDKGIPKAKKRHKKHKSRENEKKKDRKHKLVPKDSSSKVDKEKISNGHHNFGPENLQKLQDKKRKFEGSDDLSSIQRRHNVR